MRDNPMHVPPRRRLDIVSDPDLVVLGRLDGTEVARFTAWGATWEEIADTLARYESREGGFVGPCEMLVGAGTR